MAADGRGPSGAACFAVALAIGSAAALPGRGETRPPERAADAGIEQIRVSAQKREAALLDTNISITALGESELELRGIEDALDLGEHTPNVNFQLGADGNGFSVITRGVGLVDVGSITRDPAMGLYLDGVYFGPSIGNLIELIDLERVEVLRGPQGDLWGRNTTVGAINLTTRRPSGGLGARTLLGAGSKRAYDLRAALDLPIWGGEGFPLPEGFGVLAGTLSFAALGHDAFDPNHVAPDVQELDRLAGRAAASWELGALRADYTFHANRAEEQGPEMQLTFVDAGAPLFNGSAAGMGLGGIDMRPYASRPRRTHLDLDGVGRRDEQEIESHALRLRYDWIDVPLLGALELRSITGYLETQVRSVNDRDGTPFDVLHTVAETTEQQLTQEVNLIGTTRGGLGELEYTLGYFYFREEGDTLAEQLAFQDSAFDAVFVPGVGSVDLGQTTRQVPGIDNASHAVFGHLAYRPRALDARVKLEAGQRYTPDTKRVESSKLTLNDSGAPSALPNFGPTSASRRFSELTPTARLSGRLLEGAEQLNAYFSFATGFTAGGFNSRATRVEDLLDPYDPETVYAYELGFKYRGLGERLRVTAAGFYMDYEDLQRTTLVDAGGGVFASRVINAERARIWGAEIEALAMPYEGLLVNAGYGLTLPRYVEFVDEIPGCTPVGSPACRRDFADERRFGNTPEHNLTGGVQLTLPPLPFGQLGARVDVYWQSEILLQNGDNPLASDDPYSVVNARLFLDALPLPDGPGRLRLAVWIENAFDTEYRPFGIDFDTNSAGGLPYIVQQFGEPRTFGFELVWRIGSFP